MNEAWRARLKQWSAKILKLTGWGVAIFIFLGVIGGTVLPRLERYLGERKSAKFEQEYEAEKKKIEELYRRDTHGGVTPEETFDMLIDALKKGDIERASSYYELSVRERARGGLEKESRERGNLNLSIEYFVKVRGGEKKCHDLDNERAGCGFTIVHTYSQETKLPISGTKDFLLIPKGGSLESNASFRINSYTRIWKITQPY